MAKRMMRMDKKMCDSKWHSAHIGLPMAVLGGLILANVYWNLLSWPAFIGWIFFLAGIIKLIMHRKHR